MRVLHVNFAASAIGGVEVYLDSLLRALTDVGVTSGLLHELPRPRGEASPDWFEACVPELSPKSPAPAGARRKAILDAVERFSPDIIHLHHLESPDAYAWLVERAPTIQYIHNHYPFSCPGVGKYLPRTSSVCRRRVTPFCAVAPWLQRCGSMRPWTHLPSYFRSRAFLRPATKVSRFLVASRYMADELIANGIAAERVEVIGYPLPTDLLPAGDSEKPGTSAVPTVLFVGRLIKAKGTRLLPVLLEALPEHSRLVVIGDGPERQWTEAQCRARAGSRAVAFTGWSGREALGRHYAQADVAIVPSSWPEPFGIVGIEAMYYGKPVVAFDNGGIRDWLIDGTNGVLVPAGDTQGFTRAVLRLLHDRALAKRLGDAGRDDVRARFSLRRHAERLLAHYEALSGRGAEAIRGLSIER